LTEIVLLFVLVEVCYTATGGLRLTHWRTHGVVKVILATVTILDALFGAVVEEMEEAGDN
jgi:hypothetical protein